MNIFFYAGYFQGNTLGMNMGDFPKGGTNENTSNCMPHDRDSDNGDFLHAWMVVH
jgi:hypothetical protein